jgi:hypothetical protein
MKYGVSYKEELWVLLAIVALLVSFMCIFVFPRINRVMDGAYKGYLVFLAFGPLCTFIATHSLCPACYESDECRRRDESGAFYMISPPGTTTFMSIFFMCMGSLMNAVLMTTLKPGWWALTDPPSRCQPTHEV